MTLCHPWSRRGLPSPGVTSVLKVGGSYTAGVRSVVKGLHSPRKFDDRPDSGLNQ